VDEFRELLELGPMRTRDALAAGIGASRLRRADVAHPFRGVVADTGHDRIRAIAARLDDGQFLSHTTAGRIWGMRMPSRITDDEVHVSALVPHNAPRARGIVGHRLQERAVESTLIHGIPVTTPGETWRHLSTLLTLDELVVAGDALLARRRPLATPPELVRALARHAGARGVRRLRAAHGWVRAGTDSAPETRLRLLLVRAGLPEPEVNPTVVLRRFGAAHPDLAYRDARVAIEYDGDHHRSDRRQFEHDILRLESFARDDWRVIRVVAAHLRHPDALVLRVRAALARE